MKIKILSYNIHKGFSIGNKNFTLSKIKESIQKVEADLVFLQEVVGSEGGRDGIHSSQFEYLADKVWSHFSYGKNAVSSSGHHGNAILSKYPFIFEKKIDLSVNNIEQRGLIHGTIQIPESNQKIHVLCTHLSLLEKDRNKQINLINRYLSLNIPEDEPLIMAGDFNDWRNNLSSTLYERHGLLEAFTRQYGQCARTFPIWIPVLRLDRIYFRNIELETVALYSKAPWDKLSDHVALFGEFKMVLK